MAGSGNCSGKKVNINIKEDDWLLGVKNVSINPQSATFSNDTAQTSWVAEYQQDGIYGVWDPPEYFFEAQISGNSEKTKSSNYLLVTKLLAGQSSKGDGDYDGKTDLKDLSILFTHWNKNKNFPINLDINDDSLINSFDLS